MGCDQAAPAGTAANPRLSISDRRDPLGAQCRRLMARAHPGLADAMDDLLRHVSRVAPNRRLGKNRNRLGRAVRPFNGLPPDGVADLGPLYDTGYELPSFSSLR